MNCFERNITRITAPGFLQSAVAQHEHRFALRTLLINNVDDRVAARELAAAAVARGEIDRFAFVDEYVDSALKKTGLRLRDFGRYLHWSDCCLVALALPGPEWLCYVDVDLTLRSRGDWVAEALEAMAGDPRIGVANPNWRMSDGSSSVGREADESGPGWFKGYGFTDQIFLCRRATFARPLLSRWRPLGLTSPASLRWAAYQLPFATSSLFFEQIIDAFMRRNRIMRLTLTEREFEPIPMSAYPVTGVYERIMARIGSRWLGLLTAGRRRVPHLFQAPTLRTTGLLDPEFSGRN